MTGFEEAPPHPKAAEYVAKYREALQDKANSDGAIADVAEALIRLQENKSALEGGEEE